MTETVEPIYKEALDIIEKATPQLDDEKQKEYFTKIAESIRTASGLVNEDEEKLVRLCDAAVKYANQVMFILYRSDKTTDELTAAFRALPSAEYTGEEVRKIEAERQKRIDEINSMHEQIVNEQKDLDIFTAVIAGMSKEEAEKKMAQYEEEVRAAQQR